VDQRKYLRYRLPKPISHAHQILTSLDKPC